MTYKQKTTTQKQKNKMCFTKYQETAPIFYKMEGGIYQEDGTFLEKYLVLSTMSYEEQAADECDGAGLAEWIKTCEFHMKVMLKYCEMAPPITKFLRKLRLIVRDAKKYL